MAITYPSSLPAPLVGSLTEEFLDTFVDDSGEVGSLRRRARFTKALARFGYALILSAAQKAALDTFYVTTLANGVSAFEWTHPQTSVVYTVQFAGRPVATSILIDSYRVPIRLEET